MEGSGQQDRKTQEGLLSAPQSHVGPKQTTVMLGRPRDAAAALAGRSLMEYESNTTGSSSTWLRRTAGHLTL